MNRYFYRNREEISRHLLFYANQKKKKIEKKNKEIIRKKDEAWNKNETRETST